MRKLRILSISTFTILAIISIFYVFKLKFAFSLDQFFPEGDKELEFFQEFIKDFEKDINFLLVAVERKDGVFEQSFLEDFHDFSLATRKLPHVKEVQALTMVAYPLKTPFTITSIPAIHIDQPAKYKKDKDRILQDDRFVNTLINEDATALVVAIKTEDNVMLKESNKLITSMNELISKYAFEDYHYMGPSYFQKEMVEMQMREVIVSSIVSGILVFIVMFWLFRKPWGIAISITSIGLGLLLFMGLMGVAGWELNIMAALYPVLMIIVGTSDVIHIMSKYIDELRKGKTRKEAITITIKEIGLATLLTSVTTAVGFATLMTSKISPIKDFGMNAAIGVIIAYITVIFFTTAVLSLLKTDQLIKLGKGQMFWEKLMQWIYHYTKNNSKTIIVGSLVALVVCLYGISMITTNYRIESNLPRGKKITADFMYFEDAFAGFRPMEFAVFAQQDYKADDYKVLQEIDKLEKHLHTFPSIKSITSVTAIYKSINQMYGQNKKESYRMPDTEIAYERYKKIANKIPDSNTNVLISKDQKKARITSRVLDLGADEVQNLAGEIDQWIAENIDSSVVQFRQTGTGFILDKNAQYVRRNLLEGLALAILIVGLLMGLLFRNWKMVLISMIPNIFPLLLAGAILGYLGIELESGIAIIFAVIFGIAVDDSIHFLSKYKLSKEKGLDMEAALHVTFLESGKAICLTSVILFFGFLIMLFSIHPPSVTVGVLISITLFSALLTDLFLLPVLIRGILKK
ncbi:MAG: putative RND superfamily exporter protein [Saprospiraceae bacterium]|jgi:predicted RND superfamily exporter protein